MQIKLPFTEYEFTYKAIDKIHFPEFSGSLWHSVLGKALRDFSCKLKPQSECGTCVFSNDCEYSILFRGVNLYNPEESREIPSPHIIKPYQLFEHTIPKGHTFSVNIVLLGEVNSYLTTLVRAMFIVGRSGFGEQRSKAKLIRVSQVFSEKENTIILDQNTPMRSGLMQETSIPELPQKAYLKFVSPYKPTGKSAKSSTLQLDRLLMNIIRRTSLLYYFATGKRLKDDFRKLKKQTETVPIVTHDLHWVKNKHIAIDKNKKNHKHGWLGSIEIDLHQHQDLWKYIYLGQLLHAGKNASMGYGIYNVKKIFDK